MQRLRRHAEIVEDHDHHEQVVDAQRQLDDVPGEERERDGAALEHPQPHGEQECERDPGGHPHARFLGPDHVRSAMEDAEVERQHRQHERNESDPEPDVGGHAPQN